jgi:hypothetical protein
MIIMVFHSALHVPDEMCTLPEVKMDRAELRQYTDRALLLYKCDLPSLPKGVHVIVASIEYGDEITRISARENKCFTPYVEGTPIESGESVYALPGEKIGIGAVGDRKPFREFVLR